MVDGLLLQLSQLLGGSSSLQGLLELVAHRGHAENGVQHLDVLLVLCDLLLLAGQELGAYLHFLYKWLDTLFLLLLELIKQALNFLV